MVRFGLEDKLDISCYANTEIPSEKNERNLFRLKTWNRYFNLF